MSSNEPVKRYGAVTIWNDDCTVRLGSHIEEMTDGIYHLAADCDRDIKAQDKSYIIVERARAFLEEKSTEQRKAIERLQASIDLLDTLPDAHKIAEQAKTIERLRDLLERVRTHPAGSWMSAALSDEDHSCAELKRDFGAWFDFLGEISVALKEKT